MKITITPSRPQADEKHPHCSVSVELPNDDLDMEGLVDLFRSAALALGYAEKTVDDYLGHP